MRNAFLRFMSSDRGRLTRVAVGSSLLTWGLLSSATTPGKVASAVALAPLLSGLTDRFVPPSP